MTRLHGSVWGQVLLALALTSISKAADRPMPGLADPILHSLGPLGTYELRLTSKVSPSEVAAILQNAIKTTLETVAALDQKRPGSRAGYEKLDAAVTLLHQTARDVRRLMPDAMHDPTVLKSVETIEEASFLLYDGRPVKERISLANDFLALQTSADRAAERSQAHGFVRFLTADVDGCLKRLALGLERVPIRSLEAVYRQELAADIRRWVKSGVANKRANAFDWNAFDEGLSAMVDYIKKKKLDRSDDPSVQYLIAGIRRAKAQLWNHERNDNIASAVDSLREGYGKSFAEIWKHVQLDKIHPHSRTVGGEQIDRRKNTQTGTLKTRGLFLKGSLGSVKFR